MHMKDVRAGQTYAYAEDYHRKCTYNREVETNPVFIVDKSVKETFSPDGCGRLIPTRKTVLTAKRYQIPATDMRALDLELVEYDDPKLVETIQVNVVDIVSPWEAEVERARRHAEIKVKVTNFRRYQAILGCILLRKMREDIGDLVESNPTLRMDLRSKGLEKSSYFTYLTNTEVARALGSLELTEWNTHGVIANAAMPLEIQVSMRSEEAVKRDTYANSGDPSNMISSQRFEYMKLFTVSLMNVFGEMYIKQAVPKVPKFPRGADEATVRELYKQYRKDKLNPWYTKVFARLVKSTEHERYLTVVRALMTLAKQVEDFTGEKAPKFVDDLSAELKKQLHQTCDLPSVAEVENFINKNDLNTLSYAELRLAR